MQRKLPRSRPKQISSSALHPANRFVQVVRRVRRSIVSIVTQEEVKLSRNDFIMSMLFPEFQPSIQNKTTRKFGSGFIIHPDGYILTNEHVVGQTKKVFVQLFGQKHSYPAQTVWSDSRRDLAILKINAPYPFKRLKLGSSKTTEVGEWVIAVGNPLGLDHTVTVGVISGKNRPLQVDGRFYGNVIQTDAAINPGNSGGPLINILGEVIGINTLIVYPSQSIGFAIPVDDVKQLLKQLLAR